MEKYSDNNITIYYSIDENRLILSNTANRNYYQQYLVYNVQDIVNKIKKCKYNYGYDDRNGISFVRMNCDDYDSAINFNLVHKNYEDLRYRIPIVCSFTDGSTSLYHFDMCWFYISIDEYMDEQV